MYRFFSVVDLVAVSFSLLTLGLFILAGFSEVREVTVSRLHTRGLKSLLHQLKPSLCLHECVQQPLPHAVIFEQGRAGVSIHRRQGNQVGWNSGLLFKQMFMNIFWHICRVLIVIWLDGHMSLKVGDRIYWRRYNLGDELPKWALEGEDSLLALCKHGKVTWAYCSLPFLGPKGAQTLLGEHIYILSRMVCVLDCMFVHNCCLLCFPLLENIMEICHLFSLLPVTTLSPRQGLSSTPLLFSQLSWLGPLLQSQVSVKFWWYSAFSAWWTRGASGKEAKAWFYYSDYYYCH